MSLPTVKILSSGERTGLKVRRLPGICHILRQSLTSQRLEGTRVYCFFLLCISTWSLSLHSGQLQPRPVVMFSLRRTILASSFEDASQTRKHFPHHALLPVASLLGCRSGDGLDNQHSMDSDWSHRNWAVVCRSRHVICSILYIQHKDTKLDISFIYSNPQTIRRHRYLLVDRGHVLVYLS